MTAYEKIHLMNVLIGHKAENPNSSEFWEKAKNQINLVQEELDETLEAANVCDSLEFLDGICDVMVTAIGLYQMAQLSGFPAAEALETVCDNNLTKFHRDPDEANKTVNFYQDLDIECFVRLITMEDGSEYYAVIRKEDGKLLKPYNFQAVDLKGLIAQMEEQNDSDSE